MQLEYDPERTRFLYDAQEQANIMAGLAITMLTHATEGQIPAVTVIEDEQPQETYQNASTSHAKAV